MSQFNSSLAEFHFIFNRPFPSFFEPHDESVAKCNAFHVKIT